MGRPEGKKPTKRASSDGVQKKAKRKVRTLEDITASQKRPTTKETEHHVTVTEAVDMTPDDSLKIGRELFHRVLTTEGQVFDIRWLRVLLDSIEEAVPAPSGKKWCGIFNSLNAPVITYMSASCTPRTTVKLVGGGMPIALTAMAVPI